MYNWWWSGELIFLQKDTEITTANSAAGGAARVVQGLRSIGIEFGLYMRSRVLILLYRSVDIRFVY